MLWTRIGLEPCEPHPRRGALWYVYDLSLPLISDGRIAFAQLLKDPDEAKVTRFDTGGQRLEGRIRTIEGQWSMVWNSKPPACPTVVRFFARRYLKGDHVALRPGNSVMSVYKVCDMDRAQQLIEQFAG